MSSEATATMAAFAGWRAFKPGKHKSSAFTYKRLGTYWIWDGERAGFFKRRHLHDYSGLSLSVVIDFGWEEIDVPAWFNGFTEADQQYLKACAQGGVQ